MILHGSLVLRVDTVKTLRLTRSTPVTFRFLPSTEDPVESVPSSEVGRLHRKREVKKEIKKIRKFNKDNETRFIETLTCSSTMISLQGNFPEQEHSFSTFKPNKSTH